MLGIINVPTKAYLVENGIEAVRFLIADLKAVYLFSTDYCFPRLFSHSTKLSATSKTKHRERNTVLCKESDSGFFKPLVEGLLGYADRLADTQRLEVFLSGQLVRRSTADIQHGRNPQKPQRKSLDKG